MWVTIYDLGKTRQLDHGCVPGNGQRRWKSGNYLFKSFYYVRAEIKRGPDCTGPLVCDTTVQVVPINRDTAQHRVDDPNMGPGSHLMPGMKNINECFWRTTEDSQPLDERQVAAYYKSSPAWIEVNKEKAELDKCLKSNDQQAQEAYAQLAVAKKKGTPSGAELKAFDEADKVMKVHAARDKKEGMTLPKCQAVGAEIANMKTDVARYAKSAAATATVTPGKITVKSGGTVNFTINCSEGEPTVGFRPPAGGIGSNGGGSFTLRSDARKPPGEHVGIISCGGSTTTATLALTVTQ